MPKVSQLAVGRGRAGPKAAKPLLLERISQYVRPPTENCRMRQGQAQSHSAMPMLCFKRSELCGLDVVLQVTVPESDVSLLEPVNQSVGHQWNMCWVRQGRAQCRANSVLQR
jgi:hypothetical protein